MAKNIVSDPMAQVVCMQCGFPQMNYLWVGGPCARCGIDLTAYVQPRSTPTTSEAAVVLERWHDTTV